MKNLTFIPYSNDMKRLEGYYWVKFKGNFEIAHCSSIKKLSGYSTCWYRIGSDDIFYDENFDYINENRIKNPGEIPD